MSGEAIKVSKPPDCYNIENNEATKIFAKPSLQRREEEPGR
jgi:hypothetical protein